MQFGVSGTGASGSTPSAQTRTHFGCRVSGLVRVNKFRKRQFLPSLQANDHKSAPDPKDCVQPYNEK